MSVPPAGVWVRPMDGVVVLIVGGLTAWLAPRIGHYAAFLPFVLGHFLLFCNVVRLRAAYELAWSGVLVVLVFAGTLTGALALGPLFAAQLGGTVVLVGLEVRSPRSGRRRSRLPWWCWPRCRPRPSCR